MTTPRDIEVDSLEPAQTFCRVCSNGCPLLVTLQDGRAISVGGNPNNEIWSGFSCSKGRSQPEQLYHPSRLLHSQKRMPDGTLRSISSDLLMDEVAEKLSAIRDSFGPESIAAYTGTWMGDSPANNPMMGALLDAIETSMRFDANSLDQTGKLAAQALHGSWQAPAQGFDRPEVGLIVGANPLISFQGGLPQGNPGQTLSNWRADGYKLIVIDPRRSDIAKRATIHLQPLPGEDPTVLAGLLRVILTEELFDHAFVDEHVQGLDQLRSAVSPFHPDRVAAIAGVDAHDLVAAARLFASAQRGYAVGGTGANMSGHGTLNEYLLLNLATVCGLWLRAGDEVRNVPVIARSEPPRAQATAPSAPWTDHPPLSASGLLSSVAGRPVAGLVAQILSDSDQRVRALISAGGNPVASWPDQLKTAEALQRLDLLVHTDVKMSATARVADYVVAMKMPFETAAFNFLGEAAADYAPNYAGLSSPWAQYTEPVVEPPVGSDLLSFPELFYGIAQRMGLQLVLTAMLRYAVDPIVLNMSTMLSSHELLELCATGARVPLEEIRRHPGGAVFEVPPLVVAPKDPSHEGRFNVGDETMMAQLDTIARSRTRADEAGEFPFRLIPRRMPGVWNSSLHGSTVSRGRSYNPAFMNPDDLRSLGLTSGDTVEIRSRRSSIPAIVEADDGLRRGVVSMTHNYGGTPDVDPKFREVGSNTNRLLTIDSQLEPITGQPLMGNVPVNVTPLRRRRTP